MKKLLFVLAGAMLAAGSISMLATSSGRQQLARASWGMHLPNQFPDAAQQLELSGEEAEELFDLLARQQKKLGKFSDGLLTEAARDPAAREAMQRKLVDQQRANEAELTAMLGPKYPRWLEYQSNLLVRQQVEELQTRLKAGSDALSDPQAEALLAALTPEALRLDLELREWDTSEEAVVSPDLLNQHFNRTFENQRRLLEVVAPHLNEAQREEYWRVLDQILMREVALTRVLGKFGTAPVKFNRSALLPGSS